MESLRCSFLRSHFAGQPSVASARNVSCFLRLPLGPQSRNAPRPDGCGQGALHPLHRDSGPSGCKGDHPHTKWLVFFSLFLTYSFLFFFFFFFDILFFFMPLNAKVKYFRWDTLSSYFFLQVTAAYIIGVVTMDNSKCPFFLLLGLGPTSNCSWDELNSNLGQPQLS